MKVKRSGFSFAIELTAGDERHRKRRNGLARNEWCDVDHDFSLAGFSCSLDLAILAWIRNSGSFTLQ